MTKVLVFLGPAAEVALERYLIEPRDDG